VADGEAWTALRTVSGRIGIERFTMKNARLASVSGSIHANVTADNAQEYAISTVSGSVRLDLTVPATALTTLTSRSASGSAKVSDDWTTAGKRRWTIGAGEPGPTFNVKTVSGSLKASATADSSVAARNEPLPVAPDGDEGDNMTNTGEGHTHAGAHFDMDAHAEGVTTWARDFAQDFKKNFASLATPPEPPAPPAPPTPTTPVTDATGPIPAQPWTWSSGSGSPPPTAAAQETAPIPPVPQSKPERDVSTGAQSNGDSLDAERLRVLEALERGDIDIDEALARLDSDDTRGA